MLFVYKKKQRALKGENTPPDYILTSNFNNPSYYEVTTLAVRIVLP
jgi:hypothetical protein